MKTEKRKILKKIEIGKKTGKKKIVKALESEFKDFNQRTPVVQIAGIIDLGRLFNEVLRKTGYDDTVLKELVSIVDPLWDESRADEILNFGYMDKATEKFVLEQTAIPMDNGQHLTLGHWLWLQNRLFAEGPKEDDEELMGELEWLRKASPSADVIEHVGGVLRKWHTEGIEEARESLEEARESFIDSFYDAIDLLDSL